ncbi:MAG TPA: hypothetical protein VMV49_04310 [Candidatus Deferrimicrobium sp.]|nr:hypothetical protein [Candidatus Deferrimicrobium sp.]
MIPFLKIIRYFTRYEQYFMRFMFKMIKSEKLYRNRFIRFFPEFISFFAAKGVRPSIYTLQELEKVLNIIYQNHNNSESLANYGILLRPCPCRDAQRKYSKNLPNVTDVIFTSNAQSLSKGPNNVFISTDQLFKKLRQFDDAGLVHLVLGCCGVDGTGINICNCHKSVCFVLQAYLARDIKRGITVGPSIASCNPELCEGIEKCGKCLTRCIFHARIEKDGKGAVIPENCVGCGLCANTCLSTATKMGPREHYIERYFPLNILR